MHVGILVVDNVFEEMLENNSGLLSAMSDFDVMIDDEI